MMPRSRAPEDVLEQRRAAVATRTSSTNWCDRFFGTDDYPEMLAADNLDKYQLPPVPELTPSQQALVG